MKKLLAILFAAMLAASMLVVPASAVEGIPDSAYQPYVEAVQEKFKAGNISGSPQKLYFICEERKGALPPNFNLQEVEWIIAEYGENKYETFRMYDSGLGFYSGETTDKDEEEHLNCYFSLNSTLCYDCKTGKAEFLQPTISASEVAKQKETIVNTILPVAKDNGLNPVKIYSLYLPEPVDTPVVNGIGYVDLEGYFYLVEYQTKDGTYLKRIRYNEDEQKWFALTTRAIDAPDWLINLITNGRNTVVYDCSTGKASTNPFIGTVNNQAVSDSDTSVNPVEPSWIQDGSKWYYINENGAKITGWQTISGKKYHFDSSGVMQTGWKLIDGIWYYFKGSGEMATGWLQIKSGAPWYYLKSDGKMVTGWMQIDGKWYCFSNESGSLGAMYANTTTPDGVRVGADGARITNTTAVDKPDTFVDKESSATNSLEERAYRDAGYAIAHFRKQLKNPNSLILRLISSTMYDNGLTAVFAEISGMNSLGGYASDTFIAYVYDGKVYEVYAYNPIQDKVEETRNKKGEHMSLDCDKALTYEP